MDDWQDLLEAHVPSGPVREAALVPAPSWWARLLFPRLCREIAKMAADAAEMVLSVRKRAEADLEQTKAELQEAKADLQETRVREKKQEKIIEALREEREQVYEEVEHARKLAFQQARRRIDMIARLEAERDKLLRERDARAVDAANLSEPQQAELRAAAEDARHSDAQQIRVATLTGQSSGQPIFRMMIHPFGMVDITQHLSAQERENLIGDSRAKRSDIDGRLNIDIGPLLSGRRRGEIQRAERGLRFYRPGDRQRDLEAAGREHVATTGRSA